MALGLAFKTTNGRKTTGVKSGKAQIKAGVGRAGKECKQEEKFTQTNQSQESAPPTPSTHMPCLKTVEATQSSAHSSQCTHNPTHRLGSGEQPRRGTLASHLSPNPMKHCLLVWTLRSDPLSASCSLTSGPQGLPDRRLGLQANHW